MSKYLLTISIQLYTRYLFVLFTHPQLVRYLLDINLNPSISKVCLGSDEVLCAGPVLVVEGHYEGSVSENGGLVDTVPTIRADHGPICGYRIVNTHRGKVPFEVNNNFRFGLSKNIYKKIQKYFYLNSKISFNKFKNTLSIFKNIFA